MNVCIIKQKSINQVVAVIEFPDGIDDFAVLKDWCHRVGLSEDAHFKHTIGIYQVTPYQKLIDARKPING